MATPPSRDSVPAILPSSSARNGNLVLPMSEAPQLRFPAPAARAEIASGGLRGSALMAVLLALPWLKRDAWLDDVLEIEELPADILDLPRESTPYLPSGVAEITTMVREVPIRPDDELVDLGSGLGRVVILTHLLSGARTLGIEIQEPLATSAKTRSAKLGLSAVSFVHANAADTPLDGTVFFLYAPFHGEMLKKVLLRLEEVARRRPIVLCTIGIEFRDVRWLRRRDPSSVELSIYDSCVDGVPPRKLEP